MRNWLGSERARQRVLCLICLVSLGAWWAACSDRGAGLEDSRGARASSEAPARAGLRVTFDFSPDLQVDQMSLGVVPQGQPEARVRKTVPEVPRDLESGMHVVFMVPDEWHGDVVTIDVTALSQGQPVADGKGSAKILPNEIVELVVQVATKAS